MRGRQCAKYPREKAHHTARRQRGNRDERATFGKLCSRDRDCCTDPNPDAILALDDDEGILWGTLSSTIAVGKPAIRAYFERAYKAQPGHKVTFGEQKIRVYGDTAINSGYHTLSFVRGGETRTIPSRYSFVYRKHGNDWMIVDHHSSAMPEPLLIP
jgi:hypothetical protein